jgi:O-antigen ligase
MLLKLFSYLHLYLLNFSLDYLFIIHTLLIKEKSIGFMLPYVFIIIIIYLLMDIETEQIALKKTYVKA